jgi:hypothetical protein
VVVGEGGKLGEGTYHHPGRLDRRLRGPRRARFGSRGGLGRPCWVVLFGSRPGDGGLWLTLQMVYFFDVAVDSRNGVFG